MTVQKPEQDNKITDIELFISKALRTGVVLSALIIASGLLMYLITGNSGYPGNTYPTSPLQIIDGAFHLKSYAVILTGLLLLILTPVFRVGISILTFLKEKDYLYSVITLIVFIILMVSIFLGKGE